MFDESEIVEKDIEIKRQPLKFEDLQVGNLIVVPVDSSKSEKNIYEAAIIKELENDANIYIDYLQQKFDQPEVLVISDSPNYTNYCITLNEIIMILPEPKYTHRGRFVFSGKIRLNK